MVEPGGNYGWPLVTGAAEDGRFIDPVVVFPDPIALTGCAVVDGDVMFGSFDGRLLAVPRRGACDRPAEEVASFPRA